MCIAEFQRLRRTRALWCSNIGSYLNAQAPSGTCLEEGGEEMCESVDTKLHGEGQGEEVLEPIEKRVVFSTDKLYLQRLGCQAEPRYGCAAKAIMQACVVELNF